MADPASPPKKKKLPFKPTAIRRAVTTAPAASASPASVEESSPGKDGGRADDLALFRRGKEMAPMLAADLERRRRKKERQKQAEDERRRSSLGDKRPHEQGEDEGAARNDEAVISPFDDAGSPVAASMDMSDRQGAGESDLFTPPPSKRSRNHDRSSSKGNAAASSPDQPKQDAASSQTSPSTRVTRSQMQRHPAPEPEPLSTAPILLDSDSEPEIHAVKPPRPRDASPDVATEVRAVEDEDDEFAEYIRKAEAARARHQQEQQSQRNTPSVSGHGNLQASSSSSSASQNAEILITSSLPGSVPFKAIVRFDQSLRLLRNSWVATQCNRAGLHVTESDAILTWRRARVYNTSTLLHLGIRPLNDGRVSVPFAAGARTLSRSYSSSTGGLSGDKTQVHFEAWTTSSFAEVEREEAQRNEAPASPQPGGDSDDGGEEEEEEEEDVKLKVLLRARGLPDVGLTVRPATTAETLITGFRAQITASNPEGIPAGMGMQLWFDGEQLEEHMTLEEADIADRDIIEVHFRPI